MKVINNEIKNEMLSKIGFYRGKNYKRTIYVYFKNKKLWVIPYNNMSELYTCLNIEEFNEEYCENHKEMDYWERRHDYSYIGYDYHNQENEDDKIVILNGTFENAKTDFPYSGFDVFKEYVETILRYDAGGWRALSKNFMYANYLGMYTENPQLESLVKTDFKKMVYSWMQHPADDMYRKAFTKGKNFAEITTMPNWLWKKLLEQGVNIEKWDFMRIWNKQLLQESKKNALEAKKNGITVKEKDIHGFDEATVDTILNLDMTDAKTLKRIKRIINNTLDENGNRMFSIKTLFNYLERVDMYQAIPSYSAIEILEDYVRMCTQMGVEPRIDSDSLKREHDIAARNHRLWMDSKRAEFEKEKGNLFVERSKVLEKYQYEDDTYTAIVPKCIQDLINEGRNNHNCVGSYVDMFAKGTSNIFFIRKKKDPQRSYITIELNGPCTERKQAYLASNQRITDPQDWEFINTWIEHNKTLSATA